MGGIYEVRRYDGLRCHDVHNKFHQDWFRNSTVVSGGKMIPQNYFISSQIRNIGQKQALATMDREVKYIRESR
jgi:hypothetical protein